MVKIGEGAGLRVTTTAKAPVTTWGAGGATLVPTSTLVRLLFGHVTVGGATSQDVFLYIETGAGAGVYDYVVLSGAGAASDNENSSFCIPVAGGRRFYFDRTAGSESAEFAAVDLS